MLMQPNSARSESRNGRNRILSANAQRGSNSAPRGPSKGVQINRAWQLHAQTGSMQQEAVDNFSTSRTHCPQQQLQGQPLSDRQQSGASTARNNSSQNQLGSTSQRDGRALTARTHRSRTNVSATQKEKFDSLLRDEIFYNTQVGRSLNEAEKKAQTFLHSGEADRNLTTMMCEGSVNVHGVSKAASSVPQQALFQPLELNKCTVFVGETANGGVGGNQFQVLQAITARNRRNKTAKEAFDVIFQKRSLTVQKDIRAYFEKRLESRERKGSGAIFVGQQLQQASAQYSSQGTHKISYQQNQQHFQTPVAAQFQSLQSQHSPSKKTEGDSPANNNSTSAGGTSNQTNNLQSQNIHNNQQQQYVNGRRRNYFTEKNNSAGNTINTHQATEEAEVQEAQIPELNKQLSNFNATSRLNAPHYDRMDSGRKQEVLSALQKYINRMRFAPKTQSEQKATLFGHTGASNYSSNNSNQNNLSSIEQMNSMTYQNNMTGGDNGQFGMPPRFNSIKNIIQFYQQQQQQVQFDGLKISHTLPLHQKDPSNISGSDLLNALSKGGAGLVFAPKSSALSSASTTTSLGSKERQKLYHAELQHRQQLLQLQQQQDELNITRRTQWVPKKPSFQAKNYVQELSHKMQKEKSTPVKAQFDCGPWLNPEEERLSDIDLQLH